MDLNDRAWPLFPLGKVVATPGALALLNRAHFSGLEFLLKHAAGDFGEMCAEDVKTNWGAIERGDRVMSAYKVLGEERVWVITEADRSVTTLLLPSEY